MDFIDVTSDNLKQFWPEAGRWVIDDIGSGLYLAVGAMDGDEPLGLIIYTVLSDIMDGEGNTGILYYLSGDEAVINALLDEYKRRCYMFSIKSTLIETIDEKLPPILEKYGFDMEECEDADLCLTMQDLEGITQLQSLEIPPVICSLSQASPIEFRYFLQDYGESADVSPLYDIDAISMDRFDKDVSCVCLNAEGIDAAFLVRFDGENTVVTELLAGLGDQFEKKIPYLLAYSLTNALYTYTPDTKVIIRRQNKKYATMVKKLLAGKKGEKAYRGVLIEGF